MLLIRYLVPGGGGGIKRREHARKTCSSPSLMLMITGCTALVKALTYLRASAFISSGSGKSWKSRSSSGLASLTYAHLQFKGEPSNLSAESVLWLGSHSRENHRDAPQLRSHILSIFYFPLNGSFSLADLHLTFYNLAKFGRAVTTFTLTKKGN